MSRAINGHRQRKERNQTGSLLILHGINCQQIVKHLQTECADIKPSKPCCPRYEAERLLLASHKCVSHVHVLKKCRIVFFRDQTSRGLKKCKHSESKHSLLGARTQAPPRHASRVPPPLGQTSLLPPFPVFTPRRSPCDDNDRRSRSLNACPSRIPSLTTCA